MKRVVLSRLHLALSCPGSHRDDMPWEKSPPGWSARLGIAVHKALETWPAAPVWPVVSESLTPRQVQIAGRMWENVNTWARGMPTHDWCPEVSYEYNPVTKETYINADARVVRPERMFGRMDVVDPVAGVVIDWKTGFGAVEPPRTNPQVWGSAVIVARHHGLSEVTGAIVQVSETDLSHMSHLFTSSELSRYAQVLEELTGQSDFRPGAWCKWCPARSGCDARKEFEAMAAMKLSNITRGPVSHGMRILLHGGEKVGKSTFAAGAPDPVFIGLEGGLDQLGPARFPEAKRLQDVLDALHELLTGDHAFKTVVIDPLNWLETLVFKRVCEEYSKPTIDEVLGGYMKGQARAVKYWQELTDVLDGLRVKGMHVILLAHTTIRTQKNTEGQDWGSNQPALDKFGLDYFKRWVDCILYARMEEFVRVVDGRAKGMTSGARVLFTQPKPSYAAGNRYGLPESLPLQWKAFEEAVQRGHGGAEEMRVKARALAAELGVVEKCNQYLRDAGDDVGQLAAIVDGLLLKKGQVGDAE